MGKHISDCSFFFLAVAGPLLYVQESSLIRGVWSLVRDTFAAIIGELVYESYVTVMRLAWLGDFQYKTTNIHPNLCLRPCRACGARTCLGSVRNLEGNLESLEMIEG